MLLALRAFRRDLRHVCAQKAKVAPPVASDDSSSSEEEVQEKKGMVTMKPGVTKKKAAPVVSSSSDDSSDEGQPSTAVVKKALAAKANNKPKFADAKAQSVAQDSTETSSSDEDAREFCFIWSKFLFLTGRLI